MDLWNFFNEHKRVAIAFSGGVDSAYLMYAASKYASKVRAYFVKTAFQPEFELADARRLAAELGVSLIVLELDILSDESIAANPANRCYFCKKRLFDAIMQRAKEDGFSVILDGTNASDEEGDRPGMKALRELQVFSPLRMCGLTKERIRQLSKEAGLFTWDKPAYACLATRSMVGERITKEDLQRTEQAENELFQMGFRNFRVRTVGKTAKIQVTGQDMERLMKNRELVLEKLGKRYASVCLDLEARNEH